ncbi:hypothetical protein [Roseivivax sp. CAU 1761]
MRYHLVSAVVVTAALGACAPAVPDSGAGFDAYDEGRRAAVDAELEGRTDPATGRSAAAAQSPAPSAASGGAGASGDVDVAEMAAAALAREQNSGQSPVDASPGNPAPAIAATVGGMSAENDFDAVSGERSIEEDAQMIAQNRAQYQVVEPTAVPSRPNGAVSIVGFALSTSHGVGEAQYSRSAFATKKREERNCAAYGSADLAQEAFLAAGGPEKDSEGLDADGDGFACGWNPAPFRKARG